MNSVISQSSKYDNIINEYLVDFWYAYVFLSRIYRYQEVSLVRKVQFEKFYLLIWYDVSSNKQYNRKMAPQNTLWLYKDNKCLFKRRFSHQKVHMQKILHGKFVITVVQNNSTTYIPVISVIYFYLCCWSKKIKGKILWKNHCYSTVNIAINHLLKIKRKFTP